MGLLEYCITLTALIVFWTVDLVQMFVYKFLYIVLCLCVCFALCSVSFSCTFFVDRCPVFNVSLTAQILRNVRYVFCAWLTSALMLLDVIASEMGFIGECYFVILIFILFYGRINITLQNVDRFILIAENGYFWIFFNTSAHICCILC